MLVNSWRGDMDAFQCGCQLNFPTLGDSHDKFRTINPQFPSCLSFHGGDDLCGMTIAIVQSIFFSHSSPAVGGCGGKEFAETIFINLFFRGKDFHDRREVCFGFFAQFTVVSDGREDEEEKPWKICRVTLESSQFIVRGWFSSFSFEQTNIKICFYIFTSMEMIFLFFREEKLERFSRYLFPAWIERFIVVHLFRDGEVCLGFQVRGWSDEGFCFRTATSVIISLESWRKRKISIMEQKLFINFVWHVKSRGIF